ncbi:unnamed protein product [Phytophthora fragariaefolia]|uniref:Unnamed protein product n=1 Tax=Phytophthora fragariaefolia TaxID=1490495 RepID=A0A9W6X1J5_9STRA|nr:unnamed protein product [Phytophthora fragariaefolia]
MSTVIGETAVATMLCALSPTEQHGVALGFIMKEQREVAARATVHTARVVVETPLEQLRWKRGRASPPLDCRSRHCYYGSTWAYGRRLTDPTCFSTYEVFKQELRQAFEPPQNEFRSRAEFIDLQQGKYDVHAYAQRARYLVSNIVTYPIDEATKVVTFMKGLRDGPVQSYLFREYPGTLEAAITLAMQEEISLRQAKLHANIPRPIPRQVVKPTGGPEPMDLSGATTAGPQQRLGSTNGCVSDVERAVIMPVSAQHLCTRPRADMTIPGIATGKQKKLRQPAGANPPAGDAVERVDIGHAVLKTAAPSESHSHCNKKDDKPNLTILKVNSKRERSLRALVDCGASNNFVRLQSLARLDFEEVKLPQSLLERRSS